MIDSLEELEDFVPFDDAILLREFGFDAEGVGSAHGIYNPDGGVDYDDLNNADLVYPDEYTAIRPTVQMAMKWLRRKYGVYIDVTTRISDNVDKDVCCTYHITWVQNGQVMQTHDGEYCYWEEASRFGLDKALTSVLPSLIKTNEK
jgi:hypothetical protein